MEVGRVLVLPLGMVHVSAPEVAAAAHCAMFGFSGQPMTPPAYPSGWPVS